MGYPRKSRDVTDKIESIIVSLPGHSIGLSGESHGFDKNNGTVSEMWAAKILADIEATMSDPPISPKMVGRAIIDSIEFSDGDDLNLIKYIGAMACGFYGNLSYRKIIAALDSYLTTSQLSEICLYLYGWSCQQNQNTEARIIDIMTEISGFRVESSFAKLALSCGFHLRESSDEEDQKGVDFFVDGVPFDIKSSHRGAKSHFSKHANARNRVGGVKFVPPLVVDDFEGRLIVPDGRIPDILRRTNFMPMVTHAIDLYKNHEKS